MSKNTDDALPRRAPGRPRGSRNKVSQDLRADIAAAFYQLGGRQWLVRVGRQKPEVVIGLLSRIIPQETKLSVLASYQAMPIAVEARDSLPAITSSQPVLDAVYDVIQEAHTVPDDVPAASDDWLDA